MADEISASMALKFAKGSKSNAMEFLAFLDDMSGTDYFIGTQVAIATPGEALDVGNITTPGWMIAKNHSTTAAEIIYLKDSTGGAPVVEIPAGGICCFKIYGSIAELWLYAAAVATGSPELEYMIIED